MRNNAGANLISMVVNDGDCKTLVSWDDKSKKCSRFVSKVLIVLCDHVRELNCILAIKSFTSFVKRQFACFRMFQKYGTVCGWCFVRWIAENEFCWMALTYIFVLIEAIPILRIHMLVCISTANVMVQYCGFSLDCFCLSSVLEFYWLTETWSCAHACYKWIFIWVGLECIRMPQIISVWLWNRGCRQHLLSGDAVSTFAGWLWRDC